MKKCLVWLLAAALLLAGCGKKTASQAESLRQRYRDMQAAHMEAEITCHLETENRTFTVSCDWTPTGAGTTVTAPEALAGLTASVSGEDLTVSYDGAALSAGSLRDVAPANCLPWLLHAVAEGYLAEAGRETLDGADCLRMALDTTAAGDVFNGALLVALSEGRSLADAVRFAAHSASVSVTRMGAQASIPWRGELETLA